MNRAIYDIPADRFLEKLASCCRLDGLNLTDPPPEDAVRGMYRLEAPDAPDGLDGSAEAGARKAPGRA